MGIPKLAWIVGAVILVGMVIIILVGTIDAGYLSDAWEWVFSEALELEKVPPSPFE